MKILVYVRKNTRVYRILNNFENENSQITNYSLIFAHHKIFNTKYNLDYTLKNTRYFISKNFS